MKMLCRNLCSILIFITVAGAYEIKVPHMDHCVIFNQYDNIECSGNPIAEVEFDTADQPGTPCYHDDSMASHGVEFAVEDQYCSDDVDGSMVFKQTVFIGTDCDGAHEVQEFRTDECTFGLKLKTCEPVPCEDLTEE